MARIPFGTTWWGLKWLNAITGGNMESPRFARGRRYFSNGNVLRLDFDPEVLMVSARVEGSRMTPYRVRVKLPELDREKAEIFAGRVASVPTFLSSLADNQLPEEFGSIADEIGLKLFPEGERDFYSTCTCPDEVRPCKHITAVELSIVREIDGDPFKLFTYQGFDLRKALARRGIALEKNTGFFMSEERDLLVWKAPGGAEEPEAVSEDETRDPDELFGRVPLYKLKPLSDVLLRLLPEDTALFPGGRGFLQKVWNRIAKKALAADRSRGIMPDTWSRFESGPLGSYGAVIPRIGLFDSGYFDFIKPHSPESQPRALDEVRPSAWFYDAVLRFGLDEARAHSLELEVWWNVTTIALSLMKQGAVVPALLKHRNSRGTEVCRVVFEPAVASPEVREVVVTGARAVRALGVRLLDLPEGTESTSEGRFFTALTVLITALSDVLQGANEAARNKLVTGLFADRYRVLETEGCRAEVSSLSQYLRPLSFYQLPTEWIPVVTVRSRGRDMLAVNLGALMPGREKPVMLKEILASAEFAADRYTVLSALQMLGRACPELNEVLASKGKPAGIPTGQLKEFLFEACRSLELLGARVQLPKKLRSILKPKLRASISGSGGSAAGKFLTKEMLSDFSWKVTVGNRELSEAAFRELALHKGEIVQEGEDYIWLDPAEIEAIEKKMLSKKKPGYMEKLRAALSGEMDGVEVTLSENILGRLREISEEKDIPVPAGISAELRSYQKRGYAWLIKNFRLGLGSLIADDMGLGKTLQVIAAVTELKSKGEFETGKVLAVVPASLLTNWMREIRKFSPSLTAGAYYGIKRGLPEAEAMPDILLTTYGTLRRDAETLASRKWRVLILDEAQAIKNIGTGAYAAAATFPADRVIAMTGTPVENRLMECWSIFSVVQKGLLGTASEFKDNFVHQIENDHDPVAAAAFRKLIAPFMLRRVKTDKSIISDLPDCTAYELPAELTDTQKALYTEALQRNLDAIQEAESAKKDGKIRRRALVLKLITELKQICNSPSQYTKTWSEEPDSAKAETLFEKLDECWSQQNQPNKVIIFTQYREMGERLQAWIGSRYGRKPEFLHGGVSVARRAEMVDDFQTNPDTRVIVVSLKAGGVGLNLTAASYVFHYDLWWNPAVEDQATARAWRIGQNRHVLVYRLIAEGTFEERINEMLVAKRALTDLAVSSGETWVGDLSAKELRSMFTLAKS